ncbi:MAG TPA: UbiA family prenyltransferase [Kiritimatiellia bacterium]|nr:UbiA family prenyltransferase [Kiritimatiellia bacterium]HRU70211.1 UbiA family prenyltransferase [Kiritimatiellia bacterium]
MNSLQTLDPWFRLLRLPNLLTVPGDPIAGTLLAAAALSRTPDVLATAAAAGASLCLYAFGLILNDLMDIGADRLERPDRPLPSGAITVPQARMAAIAMALSGLNLALTAGRPSLYAAVVLATLILLYNGGVKRIPVVGALTMGLCRGTSLSLGALTLGTPAFVGHGGLVLLAAVGLTLCVAAFSALAAHEMDTEKPPGSLRWLPFVALLITLPAVLVAGAAQHRPEPLIPFIYVFLMVMTLMRAWLLGGILYRLQPVPSTIGGHIRNLLMVQACFCLAAGPCGLLPALFFVLLSFAFPRLSARFYSS